MRDADGNRLTDPAAMDHEKRARAACEELGRELAKAGCRLLVYSAEAHSIEPDAVRGFVSVSKERRSIEFRHPRNTGGRFTEQSFPEECIYDRGDPADDWVVSFYQSLKDADGVLLLGGRATVNIAGNVALAFEVPVAAVAAFDGAAAEVWKALKLLGRVTAEEYDMMGGVWGPATARAIVASLVRGHGLVLERKERERARNVELERFRHKAVAEKAALPALLVTAVAFIGVLIMIVRAFDGATAGRGFLALLVTTLTLAGVAGAGIRYLKAPSADGTSRALLFGGIAGFVFSVLYLAPQWAGDNTLLTARVLTGPMRWQILMASILALTGGLAADSVLTSLRKGGEIRAAQLPGVPLSPPAATEAADPVGASAGRVQRKRKRPD